MTLEKPGLTLLEGSRQALIRRTIRALINGDDAALSDGLRRLEHRGDLKAAEPPTEPDTGC